MVEVIEQERPWHPHRRGETDCFRGVTPVCMWFMIYDKYVIATMPFLSSGNSVRSRLPLQLYLAHSPTSRHQSGFVPLGHLSCLSAVHSTNHNVLFK